MQSAIDSYNQLLESFYDVHIESYNNKLLDLFYDDAIKNPSFKYLQGFIEEQYNRAKFGDESATRFILSLTDESTMNKLLDESFEFGVKSPLYKHLRT